MRALRALLLFVVTFPPCGKNISISSLDFGVSDGGFPVHPLAEFPGGFEYARLFTGPAAAGPVCAWADRFVVGVLFAAPAGFQSLCFFDGHGLPGVLAPGKFFQRPGPGRPATFFPSHHSLCWRLLRSTRPQRESAFSRRLGARLPPAGRESVIAERKEAATAGMPPAMGALRPAAEGRGADGRLPHRFCREFTIWLTLLPEFLVY